MAQWNITTSATTGRASRWAGLLWESTNKNGHPKVWLNMTHIFP